MHGKGRLFSESGAVVQDGVWVDGVFQGSKPSAPSRAPPDLLPALNFGSCRRPTYPAEARSSGAEGETVIEFVLGTAGMITSARILKPSGETESHKALDAAALAAVQACRGDSQVKDGVPIEYVGRVSYNWRLTGPEGNLSNAAPSISGRGARIDQASCEKPIYGPSIRRAEVEGSVVIQYSTDIEGKVLTADVIHSTLTSRNTCVLCEKGAPKTLTDSPWIRRLQQNSIEAVLKCRAIPPIENGRPVPGEGRITFNFSLSAPR